MQLTTKAKFGYQLLKNEEDAVKSLLETYKDKVAKTEDIDWVSFIEKNCPTNLNKFKRYKLKKDKRY